LVERPIDRAASERRLGSVCAKDARWLQGGHEKELGMHAEHACAVTKHADNALDAAKRCGTTPSSGGLHGAHALRLFYRPPIIHLRALEGGKAPGKAHPVELKFWPGQSFGGGNLSQPTSVRSKVTAPRKRVMTSLRRHRKDPKEVTGLPQVGGRDSSGDNASFLAG
jgi:hypothetical protein